MAARLFFDIFANDRTSRAFSSLKGQFDSVEAKMKRVGRQASLIGGAMTAGVTTPLLIFGKQSVALFNEQDRAMTKVRQAVEATGGAAGRTADELARMASGLQAGTVFGDEQILNEVTAQLLTFTNIAGEQFDRTQRAALDLATVLDGDLKSASIQLGKALNDPVANLSALSRAGIQFSASQKEVIKGLVASGQLAEAQTVILDELARQYGGQAAAAAETFGGKTRQLANAWGDLKEQFGGVLADLLPPLVEQLTAAVRWFSELSPETRKWSVIVGGLAAVLGPVVGGLGLLVAGIAAIGAPVALAVAAIAGLVTGLVYFRDEIGAVIGRIEAWGDTTDAWIEGQVSALGDRLSAAWTGFREVFDPVADAFVQAHVEMARVTLEKAGEMVATVRAFGADLLATLSELPGRMLQIGRDLIGGLSDGISARWEELKAYVGGLTEQLPGWFRRAWGIQSPSRLFHDIGVDAMAGLDLGLQEGADRIPATVDTILGEWERLEGGLGQISTEAGAGVTGAFEEMATGMLDPLKQALSEGEFSFSRFKDALLSIGDQLRNRLIEQTFAPIENAIAGLFSGGAGGGGGSGGFDLFGFAAKALGGFIGGGGGYAPTGGTGGLYARGGAFDRFGEVQAFAGGGVFSRPTAFGFGGGRLGVMGEAGPEAVLPLARAAGGRLGVRAQISGGGGAAPISMGDTIVNITEPGATREEIAAEIAAHRDAMLAYFERQHRLRGHLFSDAA